MTVYSTPRKPIIGVMAVLHVPTGTPNTGAVTQNTWRALPSATSQYALGFSTTSPLWSINTSSGLLTYSGPQRQFAIHGSISLDTGAGLSGFCFSHSAAALISTTNNSNFEARQCLTAGSESGINLAFLGAASIASGDTIQGIIRNLTDTTSITVRRYQLHIFPV